MPRYSLIVHMVVTTYLFVQRINFLTKFVRPSRNIAATYLIKDSRQKGTLKYGQVPNATCHPNRNH